MVKAPLKTKMHEMHTNVLLQLNSAESLGITLYRTIYIVALRMTHCQRDFANFCDETTHTMIFPIYFQSLDTLFPPSFVSSLRLTTLRDQAPSLSSQAHYHLPPRQARYHLPPCQSQQIASLHTAV
jgi:hypothetical protein